MLDALLKEVCAALLESDVNVKLVSQLRQKVKAKVKASLESSGDKVKEVNRKNVVQKVCGERSAVIGSSLKTYAPRLSSMSSSTSSIPE